MTLRIVNQFFLLDNLPRNDTPPYQVWLKMVEWFRRYRLDKIEYTDRMTDNGKDAVLDENLNEFGKELW